MHTRNILLQFNHTNQYTHQLLGMGAPHYLSVEKLKGDFLSRKSCKDKVSRDTLYKVLITYLFITCTVFSFITNFLLLKKQ